MTPPTPDSVKLRLGTRRSPLAMAQAEQARQRLCEAHGWPAEAIELVPVVASGDRIMDRPLAEIGGKALWTRELDHWLGEGRIDIAVHSAKDVETARPAEFVIGAVLERADIRDVLIGAVSISALPEGATVGTSAPRRAAQLLNARPDCRIVSFRGNVDTRLARLAAGEAQATFLAKAGLDRLGRSGVGTPLELADWLPAPGQGAIAIECRAEDEITRQLLSPVDHAESHSRLLAERSLLAALGGSCHSPIAAESHVAEGEIRLRAVLFSPDGAERVGREIRFAMGESAPISDLARELLAAAGPATRPLFSGAS